MIRSSTTIRMNAACCTWDKVSLSAVRWHEEGPVYSTCVTDCAGVLFNMVKRRLRRNLPGFCNLKRGLGFFQTCTAKGEEATPQRASSEFHKRKFFTMRVGFEPWTRLTRGCGVSILQYSKNLLWQDPKQPDRT